MKVDSFVLWLLSILYGVGFGVLWYETNWRIAGAAFLIAWGVLLQVYNQLRKAGVSV